MVGALGGISGLVQWILTKAIIQPQIANAIKAVQADSQKWAENQFPSRNDFNVHIAKDEAHHESLKGVIQDVVFDQSKTAERVSQLHDKVLVLESKR